MWALVNFLGLVEGSYQLLRSILSLSKIQYVTF